MNKDAEKDKEFVVEQFELLPEKDVMALKSEQDSKRNQAIAVQGKILAKQKGFMVDLAGIKSDAFRSL
jgi:hypothetical protein